MRHRFPHERRTGQRLARVRRSRPAGVLVSVNVGLPKDVSWQGRTVFTGVFKDPVTGPRRVRRLNVDGDGQGDLGGHGGEQRAVFVYQIDSYRYWERELGQKRLRPRAVRRELHVEGLSDDEVCIGDRYRIGTAVFEVTQPRVTCYRVGIRMNDPRIPALLVSHRRPGFYFRVLEEGEVQAGDEIVKLASGPEQMTVAEVDALLYLPGHPRQQLLRALRIPALSPGWQASFRALLDGEPGSGNAGLAVTSPPPAWPGFRRLTVTGIDRESDSVISIRLEDPDGAPLPPPRPGQYLTVRVQPDRAQRSLLRNYSLSGPPDAGYYRITVKREHDGAASGYLHTRLGVGDQLEIAAPRGTFILDDTAGARAAHQRRHRRHPGARHAPRARGGALRAGDLVAARRAQQPRPLLRRRGPRAPRLAPERPRPRLLQPPGPRRRRRPRLRQRRPSHRGAARRARAAARRRGIPLRADTVHGRDQRRSGGDRDRRLTHPHRALRARAGPDARHRRNTGASAAPTRRRSPETARRSSSRAATSRSRGAATTPACSSSPKHATYPSAGRAAPASATPARRRSIAGDLDYNPDPVEPPADGSALICCSQPRDDVVLDL